MLNWIDFLKNEEVVHHRFADGGERVLAILRRDDGLYTFANLKWFGPWEEDGVQLDDGYWSVDRNAGVFLTSALAEKEALSDGFWKSEFSK